jgi:hypothetical protein
MVQTSSCFRSTGATHGRFFINVSVIKKSEMVSIEQGTWYYFTVDLNFPGFASFNFLRYINANDERKEAIVRFLDKDYFPTRDLLLLPFTRENDYFWAKPDEILSVWTFDASKIGNAETVDLKSDWSRNILDKAAITPSLGTAKKFTKS